MHLQEIVILRADDAVLRPRSLHVLGIRSTLHACFNDSKHICSPLPEPSYYYPWHVLISVEPDLLSHLASASGPLLSCTFCLVPLTF